MEITVEQIFDIVAILETYDESSGVDLYEQCRRIDSNLNLIGFRGEWGLDGGIYSVTKINNND